MKKIYFQFLVLSSLVMPTFAFTEKSEQAANSVNKIFAQDFMYQYSKSFFQAIEEYNKDRNDTTKLVEGMNASDQKYFKEYLTKNKLKSFPEIQFKGEVATLRVGGNKIAFTVGTLFEKSVYVNGQKLILPAGTVQENLEYFQKQLSTKKKVTFLDLLISNAYADKLEHATFASLIILNNRFKKNAWCALCDDEYLDATKKNFEEVLSDIKKRAEKCESGEDEQEVLASKIDDFVNYDSAAYDLKEKMSNYFKSYTDQSITCEKMVGLIYKEQIDSGMEAPGFYTGSIGREKIERNQTKYNAYIASKCQPYTDLRTCVVNKTYDGKEVYNKLSGKAPLKYRQKLQESEYLPQQKYNLKR